MRSLATPSANCLVYTLIETSMRRAAITQLNLDRLVDSDSFVC
jgi:hypothetical protein